jgi:hypothetical protein
MIKLRTSAYIRTHRTVRGFRSCIGADGRSRRLLDEGRISVEESRRLFREQTYALSLYRPY